MNLIRYNLKFYRYLLSQWEKKVIILVKILSN